LRSAYLRAVSACVPTLIAESDPPKSQTMISEGRSAAWPLLDSQMPPVGQGRCEKKMTSISFTALCVSMAMTVGVASRRMERYGVCTRTLVSRSVASAADKACFTYPKT
jgi:hypothetical protein